MKLLCAHCNAPVTRFVRYGRWESETISTETVNLADETDIEEYEYKNYYVPSGQYVPGLMYKNDDEQQSVCINVSKADVLAHVPEYVSGMGCCDVDWGIITCSGCSTQIGVATLDCWQDKSCHFFLDDVKIKGVALIDHPEGEWSEIVQRAAIDSLPFVLNPVLIKQQNIDAAGQQTLLDLHAYMRYITHLAYARSVPANLVEEVEQIEFEMQRVWGFEQRHEYHTHWYEIPGCTCPKLDNAEFFGYDLRAINECCEFHGRVNNERN